MSSISRRRTRYDAIVKSDISAFINTPIYKSLQARATFCAQYSDNLTNHDKEQLNNAIEYYEKKICEYFCIPYPTEE